MENSKTLFYLMFLVPIALIVAGVHDGCADLNPRYVGYYDQWGHDHKFDDNGDRFWHAFLDFSLVVVGVYTAVRFVQFDRKDASDRRWGWEVVVDGVVFERPPPDAENIRQDMEGFDDKVTGCTLTDKNAGARMWCTGERDRRVVGAHLVGGGMDGDYTLARREAPDWQWTTVTADRILNVPAREVLTGAQALEVVLAFFAGQPIPPGYRWEPQRQTPA